MNLPRLPYGPFVGFPDLFRTDEHQLILEHPDGSREVRRGITGSFGPGIANVGSVPSSRVLLRIEGNIFMEDSGALVELLVGCPEADHAWERRVTMQYVWEQCSRCRAPRQPIR